MPWKETDAVQEKVRFALEWERRWEAAKGGRVDVAELCRRFGISRQTGYVWIKRFSDAGHDLRALEEKSKRPLTSPAAIELEMEDSSWRRANCTRAGDLASSAPGCSTAIRAAASPAQRRGNEVGRALRQHRARNGEHREHGSPHDQEADQDR